METRRVEEGLGVEECGGSSEDGCEDWNWREERGILEDRGNGERGGLREGLEDVEERE